MRVVYHEIDGPVSLIADPKADSRGYFVEMLRESTIQEVLGSDVKFVQENRIRSNTGVFRGFHYNRLGTQGKLVTGVTGAFFSFALDMRRDSPTYGLVARQLLEESDVPIQFWVPPGCAHGLLCLETGIAEYKSTIYYDPENEGSLSHKAVMTGVGWADVITHEKDDQVRSLEDFWNQTGGSTWTS